MNWKDITLPFADDSCLITSDKRRHEKIMNEIHDIIKSMGLSNVQSQFPTVVVNPTIAHLYYDDFVLKPLKDACEKLFSSNITYKDKFKDIHENVTIWWKTFKKIIRDKFKLKVYTQYIC